jgi:beta-glucosidase
MRNTMKTARTGSARVQDLLAQMTLKEKLAQITSFWFRELQENQQPSPEKLRKLLKNGIGQVTRVGGTSTLSPVEAARAGNAIQRFLVNETRLGIPAILHEECCAGYMGLGGTTFPQMLGVAATWRPALLEQMTNEIRKQLLAIGARQGLAPVLDVARDARWGRCEETFGEDPTLVSQFGVAYVRGLQGESLGNGVLATGKHFVGYSASLGGMNVAPTAMGWRDLWDIYLGPFQAAIRDAGLHSIMNAYVELDGDVVAASPRILSELLRGELGFDGLVVADYEAIQMIHTYHNAAEDLTDAAARAMNAGIEVELPTRACYGERLQAALEAGEVGLEAIDQAVARHLQKKIDLGLFENPYVDEGRVLEVFETPAQRSLAREIATQSLTLLKNDGILPLAKDIQRLAVIGPNAHSGRNLLGDYSYASMLERLSGAPEATARFENGKAVGIAAHMVAVPTVLDALRQRLPQAEVLYAKGCDNLDPDASDFEAAVQAAGQADAVVLVLGDRSGMTVDCTCGETRDSADLRLPGVQEALAQAVLAAGKPVIVVLVTGRPLAIGFLAENAAAILEAWLPGEEGGVAVAQALLGEINPGGKLPMSFPRHPGQLPIFYNQKPSGGKSMWHRDYTMVKAGPLYPFGHGLSYTTFEYSDLRLDRSQAAAGESLAIQLSVRNRGGRAGDEVVQLYVRDENASYPRPVKELKGFARLSLQPGETRRVTFRLPMNQLAFYNGDLELVVEAGTIKVMVGSSSDDIRLDAGFEITGPKQVAVAERIYVCPVEIE